MESPKKQPMYRYLLVLTISATVGLQTWRTLFDNFAVHMAGLEGRHIGVIQSVREVPGFLTLLIVFVMLVIREHRLSALSILALGLGIAMTGLLPSFPGLMLTTLLMSFGFHYFQTTNQSLVLQHFDVQVSPLVFGSLRSIGAASNIAVGLVIYFLVFVLDYSQIYLLIGVLIVATGLWALTRNPIDRPTIPQHRKMILRRRYWLFYLLTFLAGARRQIFVAFAVFLMVKHFHYSVQEISILFMINNGITFFLSPLIGRAIVRFGERKVLSLEYACMIFIFLAYATVQSKMLMAGLYILDHVFFSCAMAIRTYFQKMADPRDIGPSVAVGNTINHIAAVILPTVGGLLWMIDYRIPFVIGAFLGLLSLTAVQRMRIPLPPSAADRV